ncbi:MAG: redoxin domain-containing protein, partial [Gemmatimonadetes bacterium]|nr:redoxin domain-containing protein [Gemmatimonadota bacterium]
MPSESGAGSGDTASVDADADKAPDFSLNDIHGASVRLSEAAGKVTLVDFWATWCAPCREEIPMLKRAPRDLRRAGADDPGDLR